MHTEGKNDMRSRICLKRLKPQTLVNYWSWLWAMGVIRIRHTTLSPCMFEILQDYKIKIKLYLSQSFLSPYVSKSYKR